jgi:hypothetical protein
MAGYSATPLAKKLGIKPGYKILLINPPSEYLNWISPLPENIKILKKPGKDLIDFIHLFAVDKKSFERHFIESKIKIQKAGMIWVSWLKKSSGVATDLDENMIRDFGLKNGLVDVKVCAVSEQWSGLKFVFRLKDREDEF